MNGINKREIDRLIPKAIEAVEQVWEIKGESRDERAIANEFHGYVSSFGAMMVNSTPLAAIIHYSVTDENSNSSEDKSKIPQAILKIIGGDHNSLRDYYTREEGTEKTKKTAIATAAIALKMALRTFPKPIKK